MRSSTFTTYINTVDDQGAYAAFDRLAGVAVARYATISKAAENAAKAISGVTSGATVRGAIDTQAKSLKSIAEAQRDIGRASEQTTRRAEGAGGALRRLAGDTRTAAAGNRALAQSLESVSAALTVAQGRLGPVAGRVYGLTRALQELTGFQFGLAGVGLALYQIGQAGNNYTILQSKLRPFFDTQEQANAAFERSIDIARRAKAPLETITDLYGRLTAIGPDVGIDPGRVARLVEIASKAATLSGGSAETRKVGLGQFLQGIGSNNLGGDELRSVKENTFALAQAIADGFKNADGSIGTTIGKLKELGAQGELTVAAIADALERSSPRIEQQFSKLPLTLSQAGTNFTTSATVFIGELDRSVKLTDTLARGLDLVSTYLREAVALAAGFAVAFSSRTIIDTTGKIGAGIRAVTLGILENRAQLKAADDEWKAGLSRRVAGYEREAQALQRQRQRILDNITVLQRQRAVAQTDVERSFATDTNPASQTRYAAAVEERRRVTRDLVDEQRRLEQVERNLTANGAALVTSQGRLAAATANVAQRMNLLKTAGSSLLAFFGGPWGLALTAATVALTLFATRVDQGKKAVEDLGGELGRFQTYLDGVARKAEIASGKVRQLGLDQRRQQLRDAGENLQKARSEGASRLRGLISSQVDQASLGGRLDVSSLPGQDPATRAARASALALIDRLEKGQQNAFSVYNRLQAIARRYPGVINPAALRQSKNAGGGIDIAFSAEDAFNDRVQRITGTRPSEPGAAKPKTRSQLAADAAALAAQTDLQRARAAYQQIYAQGRQSSETEQQYTERLADARRAIDAATEAEKQRRAAIAGTRREQRAAVRESEQTAVENAVRKRDDALLGLARSGLNPRSEEYLQKREEIIKAWQDETNAISATRQASNAYAAEEIRNAERIAAEADKFADYRANTLASYTDEPTAVVRATKAIAELQSRIDSTIRSADGKLVLYSEAQFADDKRRIEEGLQRPYREYLRDRARDVEIQKLLLQGRDDEATALREAYSLYDQIGTLTQQQYEQILANVRAENRLNDLLAARDRITRTIQNTVDIARDGFEQLLVDIPSRGPAAIGDFYKTIQTQVLRITARQISERIFSGADEKVRSLLQGRNSVDRAIYAFNGSIGQAKTATDTLGNSVVTVENSLDRLAGSIDKAADRIERGPNAAGTGRVDSSIAGGAGVGSLGALLPALTTASTSAAAAAASAAKAATRAGDASDKIDVVVTGARTKKNQADTPGLSVDSADAIGAVFQNLFSKSSFLTKVGSVFAQAVKDAGIGSFASGLVSGRDSNQTGASIGGAIGGTAGRVIGTAIGGPAGGQIGSFIGSGIGGIIGGLFKATPKAKGGAITNTYGDVSVTGNNKDAKQAVSEASKSIQQGIQQIADALGAQVGAFSVSIAKYKDSFRVDPTGGGSDGGKYGNKYGVTKFDNDPQGAIAFAIADAISDGAIKGIREGTKRLLKSGSDLNRALSRAVSFEQVFKDLKARTDPVGAAVDQVNAKFETLIGIFKDAGASAQEYADLQKLYDYERADAIKAATDSAIGAIDQFIKDATGGSNSPLNKRTTYENAQSELAKYKDQILSGKTVDSNDLLSAARNFQDASRNLYGSSSSFFSDFNGLLDLLKQARDNAAGTSNLTTLPPSPLASDPTVQAKLAELSQRQIDVTQSQTDILGDKLDRLADLLGGGYGANDNGGASLGLLPGFGGGLTFYNLS